jgi:hypothetical protein
MLTPQFEANTRRIINRLKTEDWQNIGGGKHDKFEQQLRTGEHHPAAARPVAAGRYGKSTWRKPVCAHRPPDDGRALTQGFRIGLE